MKEGERQVSKSGEKKKNRLMEGESRQHPGGSRLRMLDGMDGGIGDVGRSTRRNPGNVEIMG